MTEFLNIINWLVANNHLVAWIIAAITGAAYRLYRQRHNDNNVTADLDYIQRVAKDLSHAVNANSNIPQNEVKSAIVSGVSQAVESYNENHRTRTINVTPTDISHAADIAIDYYKKNFGNFDNVKKTILDDAKIAEGFASEATVTPSSAAAQPTSVASSANDIDKLIDQKVEDYIKNRLSNAKFSYADSESNKGAK